MKIYLKDVCLNTRNNDLADYKDELENSIKRCRESLLMLGAATPRRVYDSDGGELDWNDHVSFEVNSILEELEEYYRDYSLTLYALSDPTSYDDPYAEFKELSENPEGSL